jgi:glycosyltransferase involved in cell wall biosynthesis
MPAVSVCIPVYNGGRFISEAIQSVLDQTYKDLEIIVVDNQSTDDTVAIVKSFTDPRIRFYQNESNLGLIPNWNIAMSKSDAKYIKILPADDLIYPHCLELEVNILENDKKNQISMVCGRKNIIDDKGRVLFSRGFSKSECQVNGQAAINKNIRSGGNIIGEPGSILFRREILNRTGNFNSEFFYVLDLDMWYKILLLGDLYNLPDIVAAFRISTASESTKVKDSQRKDIDKFNRKLLMDGRYGVTKWSYFIGAINARLSTIAKKFLYRVLLR